MTGSALSRLSLLLSLSSLIITLLLKIPSLFPSQQVDFDEFSDYFLHDSRLDEARQREQAEAEAEWKSLEAVRLKKEVRRKKEKREEEQQREEEEREGVCFVCALCVL